MLQLSASSSHADDAMRVEWNRELLGAVAAAYQALLSSLPRHLGGLPAEAMYRYWPTEGTIALDELGETLLAPLYATVAERELFLAQPRDHDDERPQKKLRRLNDGYLMPTGLDARVQAFVQALWSSCLTT